MTLSIAWVRKVKNCEELVVATDSRLRGGYAWDSCPKIIALPRSDSVICFAGSTQDAYPLMLQMRLAIEMHPPSRDRAMDIIDMKGHTLRVFNYMRNFIHDLPRGEDEPQEPEVVFLLGGYSWRKKAFLIWWLYYDRGIRKFTFRPAKLWRGVSGQKKIAFIGDGVSEAKARLKRLLAERNRLIEGGFDMEPFEVLRDIIRENVSPLIGGPPQLVKVYQHMNCVPHGVYWPDKNSGTITVLGRPLLDYETTILPVLDPDTMKVSKLFPLS